MINIEDEYKKIADSADLYDDIEKVAAKFGLHIDQIGELDAEVRDILFGVTDPKDLTNDIRKRLEVDHTLAEQIAQEVNTDIFQSIRSKLQARTSDDATSNDISSIERAGGFEIEREDHAAGKQGHDDHPIYGSQSPLKTNNVNLLSGAQPAAAGESLKEPLVEQLLRSGAVVPEKKTIATPPPPTGARPAPAPKPQPKPGTSGADPYREPIE